MGGNSPDPARRFPAVEEGYIANKGTRKEGFRKTLHYDPWLGITC